MTSSPSLRQPTNKWLVLVIVCVAQFMVILDATIVNVALPSIQRGLDFSPGDLQWVINAYTLLFGGFLLLGGRAGDLIGRKRLFVIGVAVFTIASLINGLAQSSGMLIAGRALQGLGGALVAPAVLSIITTTFTDNAERTRALGVWSAIAAGGGAVGLILGGVLTDLLSWEWIFFVNVPIGAAGILAAMRYVPESRGELGHRAFDIAGAVSVTGGLVVLVFAIVKAQDYGWGSGRTLGLGAAALALLAAFVVIEHRSRLPLMRLGIFRIRALATANLSMLLVASGLFAMFFFLTLYLQNILGYSPLKTGVAFLPITAGIAVGAGIAQKIIKPLGIRAVSIVGLVLATGGMILLTSLPVDGSYVSDLLVGLVPLSVGMGLVFVPITLMATSGVAAADSGLASGLFNATQQVGGALGLAVLSTLATDHTTSAVRDGTAAPVAQVDGFQIAFVGGAILLGAGAVLLIALLRRRHTASIDTEAPAPAPA